MKQKIRVEDLKLGMYVSELDRPWQGTPYLLQGVELRTLEDIEELRRYCRYVYVELPAVPAEIPQYFPERILDSPVPESVAPPPPPLAPVPRVLPPAPAERSEYPDVVTLEQEIQRATEIERRARDLLSSMMRDIRRGKSLDLVAVQDCVSEMVNSVIRNPDALVWFTQLKGKDELSAFHSLRTGILALSLGRQLGFPKERLHLLGVGALLHDIGKIRISTELLNRPGRLSAKELEIVRTHVAHGVRILQDTPGMPPEVVETVYHHHERYDGSGYPQGLLGEQISQPGMICAIADFYDAALGDQSYNPNYSAHTVLNRMYDLRDLWFPAELVEQFIQSMSIYPIGSIVEFHSGEIGVVLTVNRSRRLRPRVALVLDPDKTPYPQPRYIDLMRQDIENGPRHEIARALAPNTYRINPIDYVP